MKLPFRNRSLFPPASHTSTAAKTLDLKFFISVLATSISGTPIKALLSSAIVAGLLAGCASTNPEGRSYARGPDKQFGGSLEGALTGAGTGAVTGFHVSSATGPGALIGAGFGAVAGGIQGYTDDQSEDRLNTLSADINKQQGSAFAQKVLQQHFAARERLSPGRDVFPADMFFNSDESTLSREGQVVTTEIGRLRKDHLPWSRLQVVVYTQAKDPESEYALGLSRERAAAITNALIHAGLEARRIEPKAAVVASPIIDDPDDAPDRYSQAVEFIAPDS